MKKQVEQQPLVLGFGNKARSGKDTAASIIMQERGSKYNIQRISFADALRKEVDDRCYELIKTKVADSYKGALSTMCIEWGVEFDKTAPSDEIYPFGKQRRLLQAIGEGRRREDPAYWLKRWVLVVEKAEADIVIVPDVRYPNEMARIKMMGGETVRFTREGYVGLEAETASHVSEIALDDAHFDHNIVVPDGNLEMLRMKALHVFDYILHHRQHGW